MIPDILEHNIFQLKLQYTNGFINRLLRPKHSNSECWICLDIKRNGQSQRSELYYVNLSQNNQKALVDVLGMLTIW